MPKSINKKSKTEQIEIKDAVLLLRYRSTDPAVRTLRYMSYKQIASFLKLTIY